MANSIKPPLKSEIFWIILNDFKSLIQRIALKEDLSKDANGGSYESNFRMIPLFIIFIKDIL
jgi:hypothetical protein